MTSKKSNQQQQPMETHMPKEKSRRYVIALTDDELNLIVNLAATGASLAAAVTRAAYAANDDTAAERANADYSRCDNLRINLASKSRTGSMPYLRKLVEDNFAAEMQAADFFRARGEPADEKELERAAQLCGVIHGL